MISPSSSFSRLFRIAALSALSIMVVAPLASSQGPSSIAEENEQLKERVDDLDSKLKMARARIVALNEEVDRLRKLLADAQKGQGPSRSTPTRDRSADPMASPSILFNHLTEKYTETMGSMPLDTKADQTRYKRAVGGWVRDMQRSITGSVQWTIRVIDGSQVQARQPRVTYEVVDPETGRALGKQTSSVFPSRFARMISSNSAQELWLLGGQLSAMPTLNNRRPEEGDDPEAPLFIGPYAEFGFELSIRNLEPAP